MTIGYQAFIQLRAPAPDGVTRWHSTTGCVPTVTAALAESAHYVSWMWLRAMYGGAPPTQYLLTAHDKVYVRVAVVPCDHPYSATMTVLPAEAATYELAYPPPYIDGALAFTAVTEPA